MKRIFKRILIQLLVAVILVEILLRIFYFQKNGNETFALLSAYRSVAFRTTNNYADKLIANHNKIRPDSFLVNKNIVTEVIESNSFEYYPWIEYKNIDYTGKYVNVQGLIRKSTPSIFINELKNKPLKIFLFGGSTMFGFDVMDSETIPSALVKLYSETCHTCPSIEVYNYGIPAYYSYNELMLLTHLVYTDNKPDIAIFLDGINEFVISRAARERLPWFYYRLKFSNANTFINIKDSTLSLFNLFPGETPEFAHSEIVENYLSNIRNIDTVCTTHNIIPLFFIQPTAYYLYTNKSNDSICDPASNKLIELGYPILEKKCDTSENMIFLGNMLMREKSRPFIDQLHYSPEMNTKIANEILQRLRMAIDLNSN